MATSPDRKNLSIQAIKYRLRGALTTHETDNGQTAYSVDFSHLLDKLGETLGGNKNPNDFFRTLIFAYQALVVLRAQELVKPDTQREFSFFLSVLSIFVRIAYGVSPSLKKDYE